MNSNINKTELNRQLEDALKRVTDEKNRFAVAAELINSANWSFWLDENDEITDAEFYGDPSKVLGIDLKIGPHAWEEILHPDDKAAALKAFNAAIKDHSGKTPYDVYYRMRDKYGNYNWFRSTGKIIEHEDGSREFFGIHVNINDSVEEREKLILGAMPISSDILTKANIGLWAFELDEGDLPRMYVDEAMLGLIGLDHQVPPEETYHAWYDHIDEGSYSLVADAVEKMGSGEHAEVQYPWHHPDGSTMIVRCGGVRNFEYTKGIRIEGTHQNVTEVLHFDEEQQRLNAQLIDRMSDADGLFLINCETDVRKTIHNIRNKDAGMLGEENYTSKRETYLNNSVAEMDRDMMREMTALDYMLARAQRDGEYVVDYREISSGVQRFYEMRVTRFSDEEVLQSFKEKDQEIINRLIFDSIKDDYYAFFGVDLDSGYTQILKKSPWYDEAQEGDVVKYTPIIQDIAKSYEGETREFFERIGNIEYLKQRFAEDDSATYTYKSTIVEGNRWVNVSERVLARNADEIPSLFALGFSLLDAEASEKAELQSQLRQDMQMIGGLASEYHALYYYNLGSGDFRVYSLDENKLPKAASIIAQGGEPVEILRNFGATELVHPEDRYIFDTINNEYIRRELAHRKKITFRFRRNFNGEYLWTELDIIKYESIDEPANAIALGFAERDKAIKAEEEQQKQLKDALAEAQAASKAKTEFLFNMSHDVRTPMNAILGFTDMAEKHIDDKEKVKDCLNKTRLSGNLLLTLINSVLDVSRIESGGAGNDIREGDVYLSFASIEDTLREEAEKKDIDISFEFGEIFDRYVYADFGRSIRVFTNLISNAVKYTNVGGYVKVRCEQIAPEENGYASYKYTVEDNGLGMSEEFQKRMFEAFTREHNSTTSGIQGTGLGLSVCKSFVDYLGGTIECESELGKGTKFTIVLPFKVQQGKDYTDPASGAVFHADAEDDSKVDFTGKRVLVVEDNELNREIVTDLLEEAGLIVDEAEDGDVAVKMVQKHVFDGDDEYYDFILMDIQMPRMNGYEATKAIRDIPTKFNTRMPIIALSANAFDEDRKASIEAGMDAHIAKPINVQELFDTLKKFL